MRYARITLTLVLALLVLSSAAHADGASGAPPGALQAAPDAACEAPPPFPPPQSGPGGVEDGWDHSRHKLIRVYGPANHRGADVIVNPGQPQRIVAKFAYGVVDKDLSDETVEVWVQDRPPCGPWLLVGTGKTSDDDDPHTRWGVDDDGGRLYFEVPAEHARGVGRHPVRLRVRGDGSTAALTLYVVRPGTGAVVFDIDGTLTTDDFEFVRQVLQHLKEKKYVPKARDGAVDTVRRWAAAGYLPVYLTGRPDIVYALSSEWLSSQGFPPGPLRLTDRNREALPTETGVGAYKTRHLKAWLDDAHLAIAAAYGNASTDIFAYGQAGLPKDAIWIVGPNAGKGDTRPIPSYPEHLETLTIPPPKVPAPR